MIATGIDDYDGDIDRMKIEQEGDVDNINDDSEFEDPFDKEHPNGFKPQTMSFGDASPEQLEKNKELAEEGFEIKTDSHLPDPLGIIPVAPKPRIIDEDGGNGVQVWKDRYYKLLALVNTFKFID